MITIAVIDDDRPLLELMSDVLNERHWTMLAVRDCDAAVEALRRAQPDAILLDVRLHGRPRGWDVLEQLQAEPDTRAIPVVVWSGDASRLDEKRSWLADRHIPVLSKPFDLDALFACLDQALVMTQVLRDEPVMVPTEDQCGVVYDHTEGDACRLEGDVKGSWSGRPQTHAPHPL